MRSSRAIKVPANGSGLDGDLAVPADPVGLVVFAHGSGSSRHSPRQHFVAGELRRAGLATLSTDLLTASEAVADERTARFRFDIDLLARRVDSIAEWAAADSEVAALPLGLFGASTGAAAALVTAAHRPEQVAAVVCRGGRTDLADEVLAQVTAPTLLVVGGQDVSVLELNRAAARRLVTSRLEVVDGATHLFEEPGALEEVAERSAAWFVRHLSAVQRTGR